MRLRPVLLAAFLIAPAMVSSASAAIIAVASPAGLGATTTVNWDAFGPPGVYSTPPAVTAFGPRTVGFASSLGILNRVNEGSGIVSNFLPGTPLLAQFTQQDNFIVNFGAPVRGVGAPIQDLQSGAFTARMRFYDESSTLLGTVEAAGTNGGLENGAVPYLGGLSDAENIKYVLLSIVDPAVDFGQRENLAIGPLNFAVTATQVPEPASTGLMVAGLLGLIGLRRRA